MLKATRPHDLHHAARAETLTARLQAVNEHSPHQEAVVDGETRLSWAALTKYATSFAAGLQAHGVAVGDVVLIQLPNWWETVVAAWGTWLAGAVVLPVVPIYRAHELGFIIDQLHPAAVVTAETYRGYPHADELGKLLRERGSTSMVIRVRSSAAPAGAHAFAAMVKTADPALATSTSPDDIALVLYTSGTTSSPKGVLHSHRTLLAETASIQHICQLTAAERVFMPSPLSHITGLAYAVVLTADLGAGAVLLDRWDPEAAVDLIEQEQCTFTVSATPFLRGITEAATRRGLPRSSLRTFVCGGADIPPELVRCACEVLGAAVVRTYGSTEMPTLTMTDPFADLQTGSGYDGRLIGANELHLRTTGDGVAELVCRGPELFLGYTDPVLNAESFTADGFFRSGDVADYTDGQLRLTGRIKDIINRGGEKFSASEVEWALLEHPAVSEVAVVAYPDSTLGERACAFVVPTGDLRPTLPQLRRHLLAAGLAVQKAPELLEVVDALPRTASGKIQKFLLRRRLASEADEPRR